MLVRFPCVRLLTSALYRRSRGRAVRLSRGRSGLLPHWQVLHAATVVDRQSCGPAAAVAVKFPECQLARGHPSDGVLVAVSRPNVSEPACSARLHAYAPMLHTAIQDRTSKDCKFQARRWFIGKNHWLRFFGLTCIKPGRRKIRACCELDATVQERVLTEDAEPSVDGGPAERGRLGSDRPKRGMASLKGGCD